ncbi:hypothetical protein [Dysgonomonas gadei]|uniref:Uncharacterized protein n=1 Tax=Dysgonomonas gadei ATCC BAA-286 TaxID=742766 RepID=F5J2Y6_9BACT|nr:hypothetical protein [Dysgonomonas gadei]EGJ99944.1 hypothetical protein HMPREF9455_03703 [Dysgonomonas gadei ATCC BAA-286]
MQKRKKNAAKKTVFNPFRAAPKEDIIGKSKFDIRQSRTEATTLINSEKEKENASIFVEKEEKKTSVAIPLDKLDEVFSTDNKTEENSDEINLEIENTPPELEPDNDFEEIDETESEEEDTEGRAGVSMALGLDFNNLASMVRTVETPDNATSEEKEEAGRVLVEIRKTDMFEQVVSGEPKKKVVVSSLMDNYFTAFHRKQQEAGELEEPTVRAPKEFDVRKFA